MLYILNLPFPLRIGGAFIFSLIISLALGKVSLTKLTSAGMLNYFREEGPESHRFKKGIPVGGGILILLALLSGIVLFANLANPLLLLTLLTSLAFGVVGFLDDRIKVVRKNSRGLSGKQKFLIHLILGLSIALWIFLYPGYNSVLQFPLLDKGVDIGWLYIPFAALVITGTSNAVNLTDGLDGLAAGCIVPAGVAYGFLAYLALVPVSLSRVAEVSFFLQMGELTVFWAALMGGVMGFLVYNIYPARMFMGDTGAQALGAALGITAVLIKKEILLLLVGGVFVIEALSVILQVISFQVWGKRIWRMSPLHHHYELKGVAEPVITVYFWLIATFLACLGLVIVIFC